ncbi:hypothetical protein BaRGS_00040381 [Batillaria attramentaria]|uniref:Uncharacterized protein n=1 Tax=Batillaria attramentaria TaxID=370345 RepID=A0ABD0J0N4_9CAEN
MPGLPFALLLAFSCLTVYGHNAETPLQNNLYGRVTDGSDSTCKPPSDEEMTSLDDVRSLVECGGKCSSNTECISFAYSDYQRTCLLYSKAWDFSQCLSLYGWVTHNRVNGLSSQSTEEPPCLNNGMEKPEGGCQCVGSYVGDRCQRLMEDCMEGKLSGHYDDNMKDPLTGDPVHWIWPQGSPYAFQVKCRGNGKTIIQNQVRTAGTTSFNRTWAEYVDGFGVPGYSHWLGLEKIYYLTNAANKNYDLNVYLREWDGEMNKIVYKDFRLTDMTQYTASLGPYVSPTSQPLDLLGAMNGQPFSTYDSDNDNNGTRNCAADYGVGWWFDNCQEDHNLNGKLMENGGENYTETTKHLYLYYGTVPPELIQYMSICLE